jgi:hypothetical protein
MVGLWISVCFSALTSNFVCLFDVMNLPCFFSFVSDQIKFTFSHFSEMSIAHFHIITKNLVKNYKVIKKYANYSHIILVTLFTAQTILMVLVKFLVEKSRLDFFMLVVASRCIF